MGDVGGPYAVERLPDYTDPPPGEHVAIGSDPWRARVVCRCGAVLRADRERRAWVNGTHELPFDGGDMVAHRDPANLGAPGSTADPDEEDEVPPVKSDTVRAVMAALGIEPGTE